MKEYIKIPVFWYENDAGQIIIDEEGMLHYFKNEVNRLSLDTKLGKQKILNKKHGIKT
mgnify:FL=1